MFLKKIPPLFLLGLFSASSFAQWNPTPGWQDSYGVDGQCYCNSTGSNAYDHNLDQKTANTPEGVKSVPQICADIKSALGSGPTSGRIPYNDIQCGHGPANDAPDEAGCPGRVDIGSAGCDVKGPTWNLERVYGNDDNNTNSVALDRSDWVIYASRRASITYRAMDGRTSSRWSTRENQRDGQWFEIDLGKKVKFNKIVLDTSNNPNDYPRGYKVKVSNTGDYYRTAATGSGNGAVTTIDFDEENARFIWIKQTGSASNWWSIGEVNVYVDQ